MRGLRSRLPAACDLAARNQCLSSFLRKGETFGSWGNVTRNFRTDINALRAISVTLVVLFHFKVVGFSGGFIGVDVFFVISGYFMTQILFANDIDLQSIAKFIKLRFIRIYPALWLAVFVCASMSLFLLDPLQSVRLSRESGYALSFVSNIFYLHHTKYFDTTSQESWLLHSWSLSVEWQFYIMYPFFLYIAKELFGYRNIPYAIALMFLLSLLICVLYPDWNAMRTFYLLPTRAWEMLAGTFAYLFPLPKRNGWITAIGSIGILLCAYALEPSVRWPSAITLVPVFCAVAIIMANIDLGRVSVYRLLHPVGIYSYSIYLWHWPILSYLRYLHPAMPTGIASFGVFLSVVAGAASYHFIERPSQRVLRGLRFRTLAAVAVTLSGLMLVEVELPSYLLAHFSTLYGVSTQLWQSYIGDANEEGERSTRCSGMVGGEIRTCVFEGESPNGASALVLGDSHAGMWMPRLEELVKSPSSGVKRISVAIHLGCPLIPGVNNDYRQCAVYNERAFELAMQGKFDHVLFISIWNYFPDGLNGLCVVEGGGCTKENARQIFLANYSKFAARIRRLADRGIKVTIVLPPPVSAFNVPVELARRRFLSLEREQVEQLSREEQELRRQLEVAALRELEDVPGVKLIDPFDALCDQERCYLIDRTGRPILFDSNHWQPGFVRHNSLIDEGITG